MPTSETIHPKKLHGGAAAAKRSGIGAISRVEELDRGYLCIGDRGNLALSFLDEHLFRVKLTFDACPDWTTTPGVLPWEKTIQASREDTERGFLFTTKKLSVRIDAEDGSITVTDAEGKVIGRQTAFSWDARGGVTGCFAMDERSHFYGLGKRLAISTSAERAIRCGIPTCMRRMCRRSRLYISRSRCCCMSMTGQAAAFFSITRDGLPSICDPGPMSFRLKARRGITITTSSMAPN